MHHDIWSVGLDEVKGAVDNVLDVVYKDAEVCEIERVGDDFKDWCMKNPKKCMFNANLEEFLFDNAVDIFASGFDLFKVMLIDDTCYTDME
jgi:hypothetical protein